jgi:hypothetical protein
MKNIDRKLLFQIIVAVMMFFAVMVFYKLGKVDSNNSLKSASNASY